MVEYIICNLNAISDQNILIFCGNTKEKILKIKNASPLSAYFWIKSFLEQIFRLPEFHSQELKRAKALYNFLTLC